MSKTAKWAYQPSQISLSEIQEIKPTAKNVEKFNQLLLRGPSFTGKNKDNADEYAALTLDLFKNLSEF